jgi:ubiquinone/menaquinone biosynthesis C-methylase UbiE
MISTSKPISHSSLKDLYDREWSVHLDRGNEDFGDIEQAFEFLNLTTALYPEHTVLEIGGGIGKLANALRLAGCNDIICTDISSVSIEYGRSRYPDLDLRLMDACNLTFDSECFDRCLSFDLLEHLPNVETHLREVYRVLKPGGLYLFQTPNILTNSVYETVRSRGFGWRIYHPSLQTASSLYKRLQQAGFDDIRFVKISPVTGYKVAQLPRLLALMYSKVNWMRLPMFLQIGFWVIAKKRNC